MTFALSPRAEELHDRAAAFKRLTAIDRTLGDADHHLERLAEAGGLYRAA